MVAVLLGLSTGLVAGCTRSAGRALPAVRKQPSVSLLFDRFPSADAIPPSAFSNREVWPSTSAGHREMESMTYQELFIDLQGPHNLGYVDHTYRRMTVRREGAVHR